MKILHTSDWHLGKKLYKKDRTPEHKLFLNWLNKTISDEEIEVLVIAGDIFDTPIPTTESLSLFFKFLKGLDELEGSPLKKVLILAGNHDSAKLLESPRPFLKREFIKVIGSLNPPSSLSEAHIGQWRLQYKERIQSKGKNYSFCLLPFFRTREILAMPWVEEIKINDPEISQEDLILESLKKWNTELLKDNKDEEQSVLISHHVFGSFMASGSEQGVALSGIDSLPLSIFEDYSALLLGHIHKKQILKKSPPALYCGSPIPLRFSESNKKSVFILEAGSEDWIIKDKLIPTYRPLLRVESSYSEYRKDIISAIEAYPQGEDPLHSYLELTLNMESPTSGLLDEIRDFIKDYPIELINYFTTINQNEDKGPSLNIKTITDKSTSELFELYLDSFDLDEDKLGLLKRSFDQLCSLQKEEQQGAQN